eukprot:2328479-Rhodomonas_salina.2
MSCSWSGKDTRQHGPTCKMHRRVPVEVQAVQVRFARPLDQRLDGLDGAHLHGQVQRGVVVVVAHVYRAPEVQQRRDGFRIAAQHCPHQRRVSILRPPQTPPDGAHRLSDKPMILSGSTVCVWWRICFLFVCLSAQLMCVC